MDQSSEYHHITALVRGLHGPQRNVSRPMITTLDASINESHDRNSFKAERTDFIISSTPSESSLDQHKIEIENSDDPNRHHHQLHHHHHNIHNIFTNTHIRVPTFVITSPNGGGVSGDQGHSHKKISFGLRRLSNTVLLKNYIS